MANVQPENGTAPIAYALLEALSRDPSINIAGRIFIWVLRNTYGRRIHGKGPRRKTCSYSWLKISKDIGSEDNRSRVSKVGRLMLQTKRLYEDKNCHIGIQKDYEKWGGWGVNLTQVKSYRVKLTPQEGQIGTLRGSNRHAYKGRAREVLAVQSKPGESYPKRPPQNLLPNGQPDTPQNRADLADCKYPLEDHPAWKSLPFKRQDQLSIDWANAESREEAARIKREHDSLRKQGLLQP